MPRKLIRNCPHSFKFVEALSVMHKASFAPQQSEAVRHRFICEHCSIPELRMPNQDTPHAPQHNQPH